MRFHKIYIENQVAEHPQTQLILNALPKNIPTMSIQKVEDVFERARKPYLQKRTTLNLFIGRKEGQLVKEAPDAYGVKGDPHYYFIHAYNCIYECEYCYLQGYFNSPDLVFYVNHDEIIAEIQRVVESHSAEETVWFHAGEFSDSLALSHITNEWPYYWEAFETLPNAKLELRTKSVNVKPILELGPLPNILVTFSLSPDTAIKEHDRNTPSLKARLGAIEKLAQWSFTLGLHFDPIIYVDGFEHKYQSLLEQILRIVPEPQIAYISLGVVRFSKDVYHEFSKNYPRSQLLAAEFVKSFDNKIRYNRPQRMYILKTVRDLCYRVGIQKEKVYLCMEKEQI